MWHRNARNQIQDAGVLLTGVDVLTGERLPWGWRLGAGAALAVPFVGVVQIRHGVRALNDVVSESGLTSRVLQTGNGLVDKALAQATDKNIYVIGNQVDTLVAKNWPGYKILDLPKSLWRPFINERWIQSITGSKAVVYLASSLTVKNLFTPLGRHRIFGQEVRQIVRAGYRMVGDYLIPK